MYITDEGFPVDAPSSQADAPAGINRASDINFFNALMSHTEQPGKRITSARVSALSGWDATESATLSRRVTRGFRDASLSKRTNDANMFPQSLAEAHIDLMSRVKVIGALAKGVDKISNMG